MGHLSKHSQHILTKMAGLWRVYGGFMAGLWQVYVRYGQRNDRTKTSTKQSQKTWE